MSLGITEVIIIGIIAIILLFGGKKITELSRAAGRATGEYKKAKRDIERELAKDESAAATTDATSVAATDDTKPTTTQSTTPTV